jgi:hypothetical protein
MAVLPPPVHADFLGIDFAEFVHDPRGELDGEVVRVYATIAEEAVERAFRTLLTQTLAAGGFTQKELANRLSVNESFVSRAVGPRNTEDNRPALKWDPAFRCELLMYNYTGSSTYFTDTLMSYVRASGFLAAINMVAKRFQKDVRTGRDLEMHEFCNLWHMYSYTGWIPGTSNANFVSDVSSSANVAMSVYTAIQNLHVEPLPPAGLCDLTTLRELDKSWRVPFLLTRFSLEFFS